MFVSYLSVKNVVFFYRFEKLLKSTKYGDLGGWKEDKLSFLGRGFVLSLLADGSS